MPLFQPRNRVEILRTMIARIVARSTLVGLERNSVIYHLLAAAADEDAMQYFQLANLRALFSIDKATGSDLDERAAEIQPATITRILSTFGSGDVTFKRSGTVGALLIPAGTLIAAEDSLGQIKFRTTANATIPNAADTITGVPVIALEAGLRGNAAAGTAVQLVTRIPTVISVTNPIAFASGFDREDDEHFRARLKLYVQALSRGTPIAIRSFALNVKLISGQRVQFARVVEPVMPTGSFIVRIDDGTGTTDQYDSSFVAADDVLLNPAIGGEMAVFTTNKPIRDDGTFQFYVNAVLLLRNIDYLLNTANGQIELTVPLLAGDVAAARYRFYTGLVQETQRVIDGDPLAPLTYPGVRAAGTQAIVLPAFAVFQSIDASASVLDDYVPSLVIANVVTAITTYINGLDVGQPVIVSEIIQRCMDVDGMYNFQITDLSGTFPATDQLMLPDQVARIAGGSITVT